MTVLERAGQIAELAAGRAAEHDATGQMSPEVARAVVDGGFARHFVPARFGGAEGTFLDVGRATVRVASACAATGWIASLAATLGRIAGFLPVEGQKEIWRDGPDPLIVGSLLPLGTAEPVTGGWRVSGSWPYVSSVEFSDWALVLARTPDDERRFFAVPRETYGIKPTWSNLGMRATGSHTLTLDPIEVPAALSFTRADLDAGRPDSATHRAPLESVAGLAFLPPILGAARGAFEAWQVISASALRPAAGSGRAGTVETTFTRCAAELRIAELIADNAARRAEAPEWDPVAVAENARDCAIAGDVLVTMTERLVRTAGTRGLSAESDLQRFWRDVHSGASHTMLRLDRAAADYTEARFPR
jgi:alkylation response protein AidB-like acyl-CoA dehydrogenase